MITKENAHHVRVLLKRQKTLFFRNKKVFVLANYMVIIFMIVAISIRLSNQPDDFPESDNSSMAQSFGSGQINFAQPCVDKQASVIGLVGDHSDDIYSILQEKMLTN